MSYDTACTSCGHHCERTKHDSVFPVPKEVPQKRWAFGSRQYRGSAASVLPLLPACLGLLATLHSNQGLLEEKVQAAGYLTQYVH